TQMELALIFAVSAVSSLLYYIFTYYRNVSKYPKGPFPLPLVGNLFSLNSRQLHQNIRELSLKFGPVFTIFVPMPIVVLADYEAVKEAFVNKGDDFAGRPNVVVDKRTQFCDNQGVGNSNGQSWKENRRQAITILRDFGMGKNLMEEQVKMSITEYLRCLENIKDKSKVDMRWPIQLMIANIINETLFGYRYDYDNCDPLINYVESFNKFLTDISSSLLRYVAVSFKWIRHIPVIKYYVVDRHIMNYIRTNVDRALEKCEGERDSECFVHAYAKKIGLSLHLTKENLYATCSDFFLAGQETTTTTLRWAMLLLAANPDKQDKLREEVLRVVGRSRLPSMADKKEMPYTTAVVHEVQRRANILMINVLRKTVTDTEVMGHKIPANTNVNGDIHQIMAFDPVFENPEEFRPERYLSTDGNTLNKELIDRTVPFSMGRRQCAAEGLARMELFLGLATTVQHYRISPSSEGEIDLTPELNIVLLPKEQMLKLE
ncbi:hypothetical protein PFISCL1PPCAC_14314, partial [Pristionchus fissidentatus]